jgi:hypothetical protein
MSLKTNIEAQRWIVVSFCVLWFVLLPFQINKPHFQILLPFYSAIIFCSGSVCYGLYSLVTGFYLRNYQLKTYFTGTKARLFGLFYTLFGVVGILILSKS